MKKIALLFILLACFGWINAENWVQVNGTLHESSSLEMVQSTPGATTLHYVLSGYEFSQVETEQGIATQIRFEEGAPILLEGAPNLPLMATSLMIPNQAKMKVNVVSASFREFDNLLIAPSKGNLTRDINPSSVPYRFGKQYAQDEFYPGDVAKLRDPYIVRDFRGQTVLIQPFQYNPVTQTLRVYYDITLEVVEAGIGTVNVLESDARPDQVNSQFAQIYGRHFINYQGADRYTPIEEDGNMLIICYADFMDAIQPFVDWKIKKGTYVELVDVATIGGSSAIKTYIADYYNTKGLAFVLLVGDSQQVPSSVTGGNDSDNNYTYIVGSDHYPDVLCGRFSAETESHVATQVQRVLDYEKTPIADTSWYRRLIGVASDQGPGDDNEYDWQHIRKIGNEKLIPYTYNYAFEYFDGSQGGNDSPGSPNASQVAEGINTGATIINYTGHGSDNSWSSSNFNSNNVNQLTNVGKLPFIISVACVNGNFVNNNCFAEAWLRAEDNGQPTGAIATIMSTINQSWDPPMAGQDEMNDVLTETYADNIKHTFAAVTISGCMLMNDEFGSGGYEMTDTWTVFGDPSLLIRTDIPQNISASHPSELHIGESSMVVTCGAEGAKAALTLNGEILGTAFVTGGSATILFDALTELGEADIVVTGYNYIPYINTIQVIPELGPFMTITNKVINDEIGGNNNGMMDYAEDILLGMGLANAGVEDGFGIYGILTSTNPHITVTSDSAFFGDLAVGDTINLTDAYGFSTDNLLPNMSLVSFTLTSHDQDGNTWTSNFVIPGHAAKLEFAGFSVDDNTGNNNGKLDAGETADILLSIKNTGSADAYEVVTQLLASNSYVTVNSGPQNFGDIVAGEAVTGSFNITVSGDTPAGYTAIFDVDALGNHEVTLTDDFYTIVGQIPVLIVNLAEVASADSMMSCLQVLQVGGEQVDALPETLEIYSSIFVLLGSYPNNHALTTEEGDALAAYLQGGGRVYMEGGDAWAYDDQTAAHALFFIKGLEDGDGDLSTIVGDDMNFMSGYSYSYDGVNNYVDRLGTYEGAEILMGNMDPAYSTAISYKNEVYRTVGASFEFAGLSNESGSTKDDVMAEILYFFGVSFTWTDIDATVEQQYQVVAYPNPFTDEVTYSYQLPESMSVQLEVFDVNGRLVYASGLQKQYVGANQLVWHAQEAQPGIYMARLSAGNDVVTHKLVRTK